MPRALIYTETESEETDAPVTRFVVHRKLTDSRPAFQTFPKEALKGDIRNLLNYMDDISRRKDESAIKISIPESRSFWIWLSISNEDTSNISDKDWMQEYILDKCSIEIASDSEMEFHGEQ
jgi:hypothetical protein